MCYPSGSPSGPCPMCRVFKPTGARCPHIRDVCFNRSLHPRHDIVHLRNAEVKSFNGCGYCKWARANPPQKLSGNHNPGWPGCCRPPTPSEQRLVPAADWPTVSIVHNIPMPPEIKSILESLASRGSPLPGMTSSSRAQALQATIPSLDRRNSGNSPTSRSSPSSGKGQPVSIQNKGARSGGSPVQPSSALTGTTPRAPGSLSQSYTDHLRQPEGSVNKHRSSLQRADLDNPLKRHPSARAAVRLYNPPKDPDLPYPPVPHPSPVESPIEEQKYPVRTLSPKRSTLLSAMATLEVGSSSGSSSDSGSSRGSESDVTVISDGAFTDYLSDESEAELQRQAEAKAALVAQNQAEEQEFKAARQQLVGVGLRPPKSWNDTNDPFRSSHALSYPGYASAAVHPAR